MSVRSKLARHLALLLGALLICGLVGCTKPRLEGGVVDDVPAGFVFDANASKARKCLPEREMLYQRAWLAFAMDDSHSSIYVTAYAGGCDELAAAEARAAQEEAYGNHVDYGPLEPLTIDGKPAWGWMETQGWDGKISSRQYKAIVDHGEQSFSVEFYSNQPAHMDVAHLQEVVASFRIARAKVHWPAVVILAGLVAGAAMFARRGVAEFQRKNDRAAA